MASAPKTVRKSSKVTSSPGSTFICFCAEAEYSPSCRLISTRCSCCRVLRDSHSSKVSPSCAPPPLPPPLPPLPPPLLAPTPLPPLPPLPPSPPPSPPATRPPPSAASSAVAAARPASSCTYRPEQRSPTISRHARGQSACAAGARGPVSVTTRVTASMTKSQSGPPPPSAAMSGPRCHSKISKSSVCGTPSSSGPSSCAHEKLCVRKTCAESTTEACVCSGLPARRDASALP